MPFKPLRPVTPTPPLPEQCLAYDDLRHGLLVRVVSITGLPEKDIDASRLPGTRGYICAFGGAIWYEAIFLADGQRCDRVDPPAACIGRRLMRHVCFQRCDDADLLALATQVMADAGLPAART